MKGVGCAGLLWNLAHKDSDPLPHAAQHLFSSTTMTKASLFLPSPIASERSHIWKCLSLDCCWETSHNIMVNFTLQDSNKTLWNRNYWWRTPSSKYMNCLPELYVWDPYHQSTYETALSICYWGILPWTRPRRCDRLRCISGRHFYCQRNLQKTMAGNLLAPHQQWAISWLQNPNPKAQSIWWKSKDMHSLTERLKQEL